LDKGNYGIANIETMTADLRLEAKEVANQKITYGLQYHVDWGESADDEQLTIYEVDGSKSKASPDTTWQGLGAFVQNEWTATYRDTIVVSLRGDWFSF